MKIIFLIRDFLFQTVKLIKIKYLLIVFQIISDFSQFNLFFLTIHHWEHGK